MHVEDLMKVDLFGEVLLRVSGVLMFVSPLLIVATCAHANLPMVRDGLALSIRIFGLLTQHLLR
jgi:hypothetical protein